MSEFHVVLGIISVKLVCKSLAMDEIVYEEIERERVMTKGEELPHLVTKK